jgi:uncharacterized protein (TIGR03085 family)
VLDLLAHLVVRESRPDAAVGIMIPPLAGHTAAVQGRVAARGFDRLLDDVAGGPPRWSPFRLIDEQANLAEFFVHCEDIRRAGDTWTPRELAPAVEAGLTAAVRRMARLTLRRAPVRLHLSTEREDLAVVGEGPEVTVIGRPGEITLWAFGRDRAAVAVHGDDAAVERLKGFDRSL